MTAQISEAILTPVILLVCWTLVMYFWMYVVRFPAVREMKIKLDPNLPRGEQMSTLPPRVRWKADNYNHLLEQPTIFYALTLALALLGQGEGLNLYCAWAYLLLRVVHSLFQALVNVIEIRFLLFTLSNVPLLIMAINGAISVI